MIEGITEFNDENVIVQNLTIDGGSTLTGGASITVTDEFHWYEGTIDQANVVTTVDASCYIASDRIKTLQESTLTIEFLVLFTDDCVINFDGDSHLHLSSSSVSEFLGHTSFLQHDHSADLLSSVNLLGKSTAFDCDLVFEPKFIMSNELNVTSTNLFLRNGCEVSGRIEFLGTSRLILQDHGTYHFDESSELIGPLTSLEGSQSPHYVSSRPTVSFHGVWQLNPDLAVHFGYFYFRETSTFTISSISVMSIARVYVYTNTDDFELDWDLESVSISGWSRLEFIDLFRNTSIHNFNIDNGHLGFLRVYNDVNFLDPITVNSGTLLFQEFLNVNLPKISVSNDGSFVIDDVTHSAYVDDIEVSASGRFEFNSVGNDLNVGNVAVLGGSFTIDDVRDNADFKEIFLNSEGTFSIKNVGHFLDFDTISASDDSSFVAQTVGMNTTIRGDFLFEDRASASVTDIGQWLVFFQGFTLQCNNNIVIGHIGHSLYTPESFMIHGKVTISDIGVDLYAEQVFEASSFFTSCSQVSISNIGNRFIVNEQFRCSKATVTADNIALDGSVALSNLNKFIVSQTLLSRGSLTVQHYLHSSVKIFQIESGSNTFTDGTDFFNISSLDTTGTLLVEDTNTIFVDDAVFRSSSNSQFRNAGTHCHFGLLLGNGGYFEVRNTPAVILSDFKSRGTNFLFRDIATIFDCPPFSISGNSRVELRYFDFEPVLFDLQITHGRLRLNSTKTVHIDHLLIDGVNVGRDGRDPAIVYFGIDYQAGWFQDGRTESLFL
ncbi:hypothetical protein GEMRC1_008302 [Eukaryota sp. GEM-RC1]